MASTPPPVSLTPPQEPPPPESTTLTRSSLFHRDAILVMGQLAAAKLFEDGHCCFWLNGEGQVEVVPMLELRTDLLPEDQAVAILVHAGYDDSRLRSYLIGRDARRRQQP